MEAINDEHQFRSPNNTWIVSKIPAWANAVDLKLIFTTKLKKMKMLTDAKRDWSLKDSRKNT